MVFRDLLIKYKKILCILIICVVIFLLIKPVKSFINNKNALTSEKYTVMSKGKSIDSIQAYGKVQTLDDSYKIYGNSNVQTIKIAKVNYEVGDTVKEGDILAVLDTSDLEKDIEESKEKLNTSKSEAAAQLKIKQDVYINLQDKYDNNLNSVVNECEKNVQAAKIDLDEKNRIYNQNEILAANDALSDENLIQSKVDLDNAQNTYDKAVSALESSKNDIEIALNTAKNEFEAAKCAYEDKSGDIALEIKEKQLEDCKIVSTKNGTITKVNAKEGTPCGSSVLFEIEDLNNLIIEADVKENDISDVFTNQRVEITTDSLGDESFTGTVLKIDPVAKKEEEDPLSLKDDSQDDEAEFIVKIKFDQYDERIRVGMNADVSIILEEKDDVFKVPCSCIVKDGDNNYIYIAEKKDGQYIVKKIPITKGNESDTEVEIYGSDIEDGIIALNSPSDYSVGKIINIKN